MQKFQKIHVNGENYIIIDAIQNLRAEDSFIHRKNKLSIFTGNGEARKYVGSYVGNSGSRLSDFFEYHNRGAAKQVNNKRAEYPTIQENCFFSKSNLLKYLYDARVEFHKQEQHYHTDISEYYNDYLNSIIDLKNEINEFSIYDVSDLVTGNPTRRRGYIRSDADIWNIWRALILPKISYLSILKLLPEKIQGKEQKPLFYFRVFLDYQFRSIVHPKLTESSSQMTEKLIDENKGAVKRTGRKGQSEYRRKVLDYMPQCPFTLIKDDVLLKASHIKPYSVCISEGKENEALDHLNGLSLTPTYDWLFDQGYITFTDNGELICGTQLSIYTWEKLHINPNAKNKMRIYPEGREKYLDYHRKFVFQDNIDDMILKS
ncbi:HNH endonuclease [Histophilus somni]|uniref:HNH endonuclease n=1 Tax=Histophilus somni TaxID=731 RepID=A0AAX2S0I6_HISSO|nr:HNH endonuclease [Histophilus somni]TDF38704.1 HNH endonuclease [Histophilus somni]TEW27708.1 HNH endonuclease [Histophilus somni]TFF00837.1 HNH endonuclease [Histophilus somni]THA89531.1 HNH endonuclease [Histophilus somni]TJY54095.1 HNH endonuclease [Histophilus somni]